MGRIGVVTFGIAATLLSCRPPTSKLVADDRFDEVLCRAGEPEHIREAVEALTEAIDLHVRAAPAKMEDPDLAALTERIDLIPIEAKITPPAGTKARVQAVYAPDGVVLKLREMTLLTGESPLFEQHSQGYLAVNVMNLLVSVWSLGVLRDRSTPILEVVPGKTVKPTQAERDAVAPIAAKLRRSIEERAPDSPWIVLDRKAPVPPSKLVVNVEVNGSRCHARIVLEMPFSPGPDFVPVRRWQAIEGGPPGATARLLAY